MKKFLKIAFVIILAGLLLYGFNKYTDGMLEQTMGHLVYKEVSTTNIREHVKKENKNIKTLSNQVNSKLTNEELAVFETIYDGISTYKPSVNIYQTMETERIFEIFDLVLCEHPEIFWTKGDCSFSSSGRLTFKYPYSYDEVKQKNALIEKKANEAIKEINPSGSDFDKALAIFDYITKHTSYATEEAKHLDDHFSVSTIEGVFLNKRAVCSGYAKAYQYLLSLAGLDAITVPGVAQTPTGKNNHAWTAQVVDGEIYFSDATWGDSYEKTEKSDFISHTYFLMNSAEMKKTHSCNTLFSCIKSDAKANGYFLEQGLYFEEYSMSALKSKIKECISNGDMGIELKFANSKVFEKTVRKLFDEQNIYIILNTIDPFSKHIKTDFINYSCDEEHNIITIFFEKN